jgi:hypothetical protein
MFQPMLKQEDVDKVAIADPTVKVALRFRDAFKRVYHDRSFAFCGRQLSPLGIEVGF